MITLISLFHFIIHSMISALHVIKLSLNNKFVAQLQTTGAYRDIRTYVYGIVIKMDGCYIMLG